MDTITYTIYYARCIDLGEMQISRFRSEADRTEWLVYANDVAARRPNRYTNITTGTKTVTTTVCDDDMYNDDGCN